MFEFLIVRDFLTELKIIQWWRWQNDKGGRVEKDRTEK